MGARPWPTVRRGAGDRGGGRAATLARAHARWGDRIAIASYLGKADAFDRAIADFSAAYADQNERDYAAFTAAIDSGRLTAQTGL
jgi:sugar/nucleoside kinase (ribokinase family)